MHINAPHRRREGDANSSPKNLVLNKTLCAARAVQQIFARFVNRMIAVLQWLMTREVIRHEYADRQQERFTQKLLGASGCIDRRGGRLDCACGEVHLVTAARGRLNWRPRTPLND